MFTRENNARFPTINTVIVFIIDINAYTFCNHVFCKTVDLDLIDMVYLGWPILRHYMSMCVCVCVFPYGTYCGPKYIRMVVAIIIIILYYCYGRDGWAAIADEIDPFCYRIFFLFFFPPTLVYASVHRV